MWVKCVLVWYSQPLTSIFGLVHSSIKKMRLECCLHPSHSMGVCCFIQNVFVGTPPGIRLAVMEWRVWIPVQRNCNDKGLNMKCFPRLWIPKPPSPSRIVSMPQRIFRTNPRLTNFCSSWWRTVSIPRIQ